jgi:3',5'-cyclic AMP phosphodiesterase CpdA
VYSFTYADTFLAVLDSTLAVTDPAKARLQADWLDAELARTRATWRLVMFHHPVYASHPSRESPSWRDLLVPILDKHRVELVLQGHDHAYLRTEPLRAGRRVESPDEGTVYVVSVSGTKFYDQSPRDYTAVGLTHVATYQTLDFETTPRRLTYRAWNREGIEVDRVVFEKTGDRALLLAR